MVVSKKVTKDNNSKNSTKIISCKRCNGKDTKTLHGYVGKKRKVDDNANDETEKQQNGMKFVFVNTGTDSF